MNGLSWRAMAAAGIVAAGTCIVAAILAFGVKGTNPGAQDFIEYRAAEQQLVHGANPYDGKAILEMEQAEGFGQNRTEFWYSPPAVLILASPLGFVSVKTELAAVVAAAALFEMWQLTKIASPLYLWSAPGWLGCAQIGARP